MSFRSLLCWFMILLAVSVSSCGGSNDSGKNEGQDRPVPPKKNK